MFTQKKPAGLRRGAWAFAACALLFGAAGCGEDPASADDIAKAVVQKQKEQDAASQGGGTAAPQTLEGQFIRMLKAGQYASSSSSSSDFDVSVAAAAGKAIGSEVVQTGRAYTVSSGKASTSMYSHTSFEVKGTTADGESTRTNYTVTWGTITDKDTADLTVTYSSWGMAGPAVTLEGKKAGVKVTSDAYSFEIRKSGDRSFSVAGTVTLENTPGAAVVLAPVLTALEKSFFKLGASSSADVQLFGMKPVVEFTYAWGQADAKYTADIKTATASRTLYLPSVGTGSSIVWELGAGNDNPPFSLTSGSGSYVLSVAGSAAAGKKAVLKFTVTNGMVAATDKVVGTLELTVK